MTRSNVTGRASRRRMFWHLRHSAARLLRAWLVQDPDARVCCSQRDRRMSLYITRLIKATNPLCLRPQRRGGKSAAWAALTSRRWRPPPRTHARGDAQATTPTCASAFAVYSVELRRPIRVVVRSHAGSGSRHVGTSGTSLCLGSSREPARVKPPMFFINVRLLLGRFMRMWKCARTS